MLLLSVVSSPHPLQEWNNREEKMQPQLLLHLKLAMVNQLPAWTVTSHKVLSHRAPKVEKVFTSGKIFMSASISVCP